MGMAGAASPGADAGSDGGGHLHDACPKLERQHCHVGIVAESDDSGIHKCDNHGRNNGYGLLAACCLCSGVGCLLATVSLLAFAAWPTCMLMISFITAWLT